MTEQQSSSSDSNAADDPPDSGGDYGATKCKRASPGTRNVADGASRERSPCASHFLSTSASRRSVSVAVSQVTELSEAIPEEDLIPETTAWWPQTSVTPQTDSTELVKDPVAENYSATAEDVDLVLEPPPEPEPEPFVDTVQRPRPKRKVIAFPSHLSVAPQTVYRLADPVTAESPRILDVPEELEAIPATPFLDGLQLDRSDPADEARNREHVELPFRAVQGFAARGRGTDRCSSGGHWRWRVRRSRLQDSRQTAAHQAADSGVSGCDVASVERPTNTCLWFTQEKPSA